jgi:serine/threonine protein phosphatase 1
VHAGVYAHLPLWQQTENVLFWQKFDNPPPHKSGKVMVCGHTSQKNGLPRNLGHAICIDTWACGTGWLTCLDVASGTIWQANQRGEQRQFLLEELPQD